MKLSIRRLMTVASVVGGLAVLSAGTALADEGQPQTHAHKNHVKHAGMLEQAQKLDGLSAEQNERIEQLKAQRHAAAEPVRQADAKLLTDLATQVDGAKVDPSALKPELTAEEQAAQAEKNADAATLAALHTLLKPGQRNQLVDRLESTSAKNEQRKQALESFRGDSFDASALVRVHVPGAHAVRIAEEKVPQMTQEQRAQFAEHLRARAAHESKS
jgi:Spy/CpxP family protein refolding chaperone